MSWLAHSRHAHAKGIRTADCRVRASKFGLESKFNIRKKVGERVVGLEEN